MNEKSVILLCLHKIFQPLALNYIPIALTSIRVILIANLTKFLIDKQAVIEYLICGDV